MERVTERISGVSRPPADVREFLAWAKPIQQGHLESTRQAALIACEEDPNGTA
jgi:hypothetical protein